MLLFLSFFSLTFSLISLWIKKTPWIWGVLLLISLLFAFLDKMINSSAFIPLSLLLGFLLTLKWNSEGLCRFLLVSSAFLISGALFYHLIPGFSSKLNLMGTEIIYEKPLVGLLFLAIIIPTIKNKLEWIHALKTSFLLATLGACFLTLFNCKTTPSLSFGGISVYLLCTIIPEEALLRGFIQKELFFFLGKDFKAHVLCIFLSAALSCLLQLIWISDLHLLTVIFMASLVYSLLYQLTHVIEATILCRFLTICLIHLK